MATWFRRFWYRLNRRRLEEALRQEMEAHRDQMDDPRRFGNTTRLRDEARDEWGWRGIDRLARDMRLAARVLRRSPDYTITAVSSLTVAGQGAPSRAAAAAVLLSSTLPARHVRASPDPRAAGVRAVDERGLSLV